MDTDYIRGRLWEMRKERPQEDTIGQRTAVVVGKFVKDMNNLVSAFKKEAVKACLEDFSTLGKAPFPPGTTPKS